MHKPFGPARCAYCHQPVTTQGEVCAAPACQSRKRVEEGAALARARQAQEVVDAEIAKRRVRKVIKQAAAEIGHPDLRTIAFGRAPYIDVPLVPLPADRRAAFTAHLAEIIDDSFANDTPEPPKDDPDYAERRAQEPAEPFVYDAACIACQGECCTMGGPRHGFLEKSTIDYQRWRDPELTPDALKEAYLAHIPDRSTRDSCVYHGASGCTLPRHWRADVCNSFQCQFRAALIRDHARKPRNGAVVAGLSRDHTDYPEAGADCLRVVSVSAENEVRVHDHLKAPAIKR